MNLSIYNNESYSVKEYENGRISVFYQYKISKKVAKRILIGSVSGWKKNSFKEAMTLFKASNEESDFNKAVKMRLYIQTLPTIDSKIYAIDLMEILNQMPFEELMFWNWKFSAMKKDAIRSLKAMYKGEKI